jgi:hypothetical protein
MAKIKTDTALDAVSTSMNEAFADLENSLMEEKSGKVDSLLEKVEVQAIPYQATNNMKVGR